MRKKRLFSVILMSAILTFTSSVIASASDSKQTSNSQQQTTLLQPGQDGYVGALNNRPSNVFIPSTDKSNTKTDSTNNTKYST